MVTKFEVSGRLDERLCALSQVKGRQDDVFNGQKKALRAHQQCEARITMTHKLYLE